MRERAETKRPQTTETPKSTSAETHHREQPRQATHTEEADDPQICRGID